MDPISQSLLEHYQSGRPLTGGRVGSLTEEEVRKLRELWRLLLAELDADAPLPVVYGTAADPGPDDVASLSFEPLQALSTKDREGGTGASTPAAEATPAASETASGASTPRKELRSGGGGGGGWLGGWWSAPASGRSTPAEDSEDNERRRMETVQGHLTRTRGDGPVVPAEFRPLFGGSAGARSARAVFWQAAAQMADADSWVLRFLRARKWDVEQAMGMVRKTLQWRAGQAIDETVYFGEARLHHHTLDSGLAFACTVDRLGSPVFIVRVRVNVARNRTVQAIKRMLCWQIETSQLLATGPSDGRVTILFDLSDFTRENIDTRLVRTLITLLTNYYPETLGVVLVYVNSLLFGALWALIAPFIDPVVRAKIVMAKRPADLAPFIDPDALPTEFGGRKKFQYAYTPPTAAENARMADAAARDAAEAHFSTAADAYTAATRAWLGEDGALDPGACGRAAARAALREAAVALDPYIRARTLYHRTGSIRPDHSVSL